MTPPAVLSHLRIGPAKLMPPYYQLPEELTARIAHGDLRPGDNTGVYEMPFTKPRVKSMRGTPPFKATRRMGSRAPVADDFYMSNSTSYLNLLDSGTTLSPGYIGHWTMGQSNLTKHKAAAGRTPAVWHLFDNAHGVDLGTTAF